ncbi:Kelch repeat-containing protein [Mucilaginibacter auburnensis]|uniref:N-acetylneuraminic acid mutarotase n=1 Tax=Mucilaginibacter auburnensis TaxID=1457233 RepID=A0A2H9VV99_9SPHI|nr:kelch repeat-containing protein [Mucilaginibacter auburnensis]PJJ84747.1 N-acetylneuraminic acid mutarotase [Mucilaginibacter auburnensis]
MKKTFLALLIGLILPCLNAFAQFENHTWKILATTGNFTPREECDFVAVRDKFYLLGGRGITEVDIFDPKTNVWTKGAKPPIELNHFQAVVYKDEVYLLSAMTGKYPHEQPVANIYIYNPKTDTWRVGDEIPADRRRGSGGVVIYKDKFYMVTGILDGHWTGNVTWFDEYNPKSGKWTKLIDAPTARDHVRAAVVGDKLYLIAGIQSNTQEKKGLANVLDAVDVYDFKSGKWNAASVKLPTPREGNSVIVIKDDIFIIAGESDKQRVAHNEVEVYNVKTNTFRSVASLVEGRHAGGAVLYKGKIYTVAGVGNKGGSPLLKSIEVFSK